MGHGDEIGAKTTRVGYGKFRRSSLCPKAPNTRAIAHRCRGFSVVASSRTCIVGRPTALHHSCARGGNALARHVGARVPRIPPASRRQALRRTCPAPVPDPCSNALIQGTRDPLAEMRLLDATIAKLDQLATLIPINGADHSFHVTVRSGRPRSRRAMSAIAST